MGDETKVQESLSSDDERLVRALYHSLLDCWNRREAGCFAALFAEDGSSVGFDGSPMNGRAEIESTLAGTGGH